MTRAQELLEEWESGEETGMRPARVQRIREDLEDVTGYPIPRRVPDIENWLKTMRGQMTKKLREAAGEYDEE